MSVIDLSPTTSRMLARANVQTSQQYGPSTTGLGGLYPLSMAAYVVDEYRLMSGWPVAVPPHDIEAISVVSATGEIVTDRETPDAVIMNSIARWIADPDNFSIDALSWYPSTANQYGVWRSSVGYLPTMFTDYEYRHGKEKFFKEAVNFDSDSQQHMWADLDQVIGGGQGYTVLMTVNLHSVYGDSDHPFVGIWAPGLPTPNTDTFSESFPSYVEVTLRGDSLYVGSESSSPTKTLSVANLLASPAPVYLAFCFGRPTATVYAGPGSGSLRSATIQIGNNSTPLTGKTVLGRSNGTRLNSADMTLLDLNVYPDCLTTAEITAEVAKLCGAYGGDQ